jgi:crossover junction endodeoxyribonuclease RuvC
VVFPYFQVKRISMRIIGIDPALRHTGYGVIETQGTKMTLVEYGVITNKPAIRHTDCLKQIYQQLKARLEISLPEEAAVEGIIYAQNTLTAITLGAARGAALLALAEANLTIFEYAPRLIKVASTGYGGAQKQQVGFMIRAMLGLRETPPPDAADALAVAITHAQNSKRLAKAKQI